MRTRDTILIIEEEASHRRSLAAALAATGARVLEAATPADGLREARSADPDLFVIDPGLPDRAGIDICRELRGWTSAPIVIVSAVHAEADKVALLRAGADDYICKPLGLHEFVARIEAQLRRARTPQRMVPLVFETGGLTIDLPRRVVRRGTTTIRLTPTESAILQVLARHAGRLVTHRQLFDAVWGREFGSPSHYLRVYVTHLRRKLELEPASPKLIITEPGVGYRLQYLGEGSAVSSVSHHSHRELPARLNTSVPTAAFSANALTQ